MNKIVKAKKCTECGVLLQSDDVDQRGYIDKEILSNDQLRLLYCNQCFDQKMEQMDAFFKPPVNPGFYSIINDAIATDALIIYVVDLLTFEDTFNRDLAKTLSDNKANVYVVCVKRDLLPENIDEEHLIKAVKKHLKEAKLRYQGILITDSSSAEGAVSFGELMQKERKGRDVYIIGARYAGKTSLITNYLKHYQNQTSKEVIQYNYPGTLLRVTEIPFDNSASAYDTPGLGIDNSVLNIVEKSLLRYLRPRKRLIPRSLSIYPNQSIIAGGFVRLDNIKGRAMTITPYFSNDIMIKKIVGRKAPSYLLYLIEKKLIKPVSQNLRKTTDFDVYDIELENDQKEVDLSVGGLGWISFQQNGQTIRLYVPRGASVSINETKIKHPEQK